MSHAGTLSDMFLAALTSTFTENNSAQLCMRMTETIIFMSRMLGFMLSVGQNNGQASISGLGLVCSIMIKYGL